MWKWNGNLIFVVLCDIRRECRNYEKYNKFLEIMWFWYLTKLYFSIILISEGFQAIFCMDEVYVRVEKASEMCKLIIVFDEFMQPEFNKSV